VTENEQKQQLSIALVHAIAARAGFACQVRLVDDDSIDVQIGAKGRIHQQSVIRSPMLEVQLKATGLDTLRGNHMSYPLPVKNYHELREETMIPRLLVVLFLPENPDLMGKIIMRTQVGGQPARVKVVLNRDDYRLACDAHRDEQRVAVTGIIHHDVKIRVYELSEPRDFEILPDT
jgi:hypothetical protein